MHFIHIDLRLALSPHLALSAFHFHLLKHFFFIVCAEHTFQNFKNYLHLRFFPAQIHFKFFTFVVTDTKSIEISAYQCQFSNDWKNARLFASIFCNVWIELNWNRVCDIRLNNKCFEIDPLTWHDVIWWARMP